MSILQSSPGGFAVRATESEIITMREPQSEPERLHSKRCFCRDGRIVRNAGQAVVRCVVCDAWCYNAPKLEIGEPQRSVSTRKDLKPQKRSKILHERDGSRCRLCGRFAGEVILHVGHLLSLEDGRNQGISEELLNSKHNLAAMCEECNLGLGKSSIPLWLSSRNSQGT